MIKFCIVLLFCSLPNIIEGTSEDANASLENIQDDIGNYNYYDERVVEVPLDHFSFARREKLGIRFLVNDTWWDRANNGPIFLYTGNEGSIDAFAENSGFMWDIAPEFGAALVFIEHRYYGQSTPSETLKDKLNEKGISVMGYLTVEQTLADFAKVITDFKVENGAEDSPVIAFGGSYGGMLTAWMRLKYPHVVAGGIAASAPFFSQEVPCGTYDAALASVFGQKGNGNCVDVIRKSWGYLNHLGKTNKGKRWLSKNWKMCQPIEKMEDIDVLKNWLEQMYGFMGMANYPYPANFLQDLPAYPVKTFCSYLADTDPASEKQVMTDLFQAININFNNSGSSDCFDYSDESMLTDSYGKQDDLAFNYQSCTELIDSECDDGVHDFFEPQEWNFDEFSDQCYQNYKVRPQRNRTDLIFGGKDIIAASNILFSNGLLDPWASYGILRNMSDSLIAVVISDAAHHLDLRGTNVADPDSVVMAREIEKSIIKKWIAEYQQNRIKVKNSFVSFESN